MKSILALAVAVAAVSFFGNTTASAQDYFGGYQFGAGLDANGGGMLRGFNREQPPYFAKFPPVYYSHIVKRPYGVSPYAAPAGIAPVEMSVPVPVTINNPYYQLEVEPVSNQAEPVIDNGANKATWIPNSYVNQPVAYANR